jgi:hypothetical protein
MEYIDRYDPSKIKTVLAGHVLKGIVYDSFIDVIWYSSLRLNSGLK